MFCVRCGYPLKTHYKFCPKCGAKQPDVVAQHLPINDRENILQGAGDMRQAADNLPIEKKNIAATASKLSVSVRYQSNGVTETVKLNLPGAIGRNHDCSLHLTDENASQQHARVYLENNAVLIEDLNSLNGTYVNGERIEEPVELLSGDEVIIGTTKLFFIVSEENQSVSAELE